MVAKPSDPGPGKGSDLTWFSNFFVLLKKNQFSHPILTQVRTDSSIFNQGIIHNDTFKDSEWDA
jgi:hypothetical protein